MTTGILQIDVGVGAGRLTSERVSAWRAQLSAPSDSWAVVLHSTTRGIFCDGLDLAALEGADAGVHSFGEWLEALAGGRRPVIAVVEGTAKGGGVGIAAAADWVIATEDASFALPEVLVGLIPAVVLPHIARRVGVARARSMALGGEALPVARAAEYGLVDEHTTEPARALERRLARWGRMDRRALGIVKQLVVEHYVAPSGWRADAVDHFTALLASDATRARLRRMNDGLMPWDANEDERG